MPMNESIAYNYYKLKCNGLIHGCFSNYGIIRIKREERARSVKMSTGTNFTSSFLTLILVMQLRMMAFFEMLLKLQMIPLNLAISATSFIYIFDIFAPSNNESI